MAVHVEITDRAGFRSVGVDLEAFYIGSQRSGCDVEIDLESAVGRILQVRASSPGRLQVRAEPGLPFLVRTASGNLGTRFESVLEGDVLSIGTAIVKLRVITLADASTSEALDPGQLADSAGPGVPIDAWYEVFMELADHLEGLTMPDKMIQAAIDAILATTSAGRVCVEIDLEPDRTQTFFQSQGGDRTPFRISRSLVEKARDLGRVVHVPVAKDDPVARTFSSVRKEGISSSIALPIQALGKLLGVLYADCVREGATLTATDLQRVAFVGRLLATALGNRNLLANLVRSDQIGEVAAHPALQSLSPAAAEMVERTKLYAPTDYTVLIRGETGTGKEVLAKALHDLSRRKKGPFVPVNCAAIPEQLMESMLFGHEKGAYTGATQARAGHFEDAHGGTLFLDEIGDMAHDLQAKILRVLQDRVVTPVGSRKSVKVDVRILAATHQDLELMAQQGRFREDLYFRLRELEIQLPPLRDRLEDLPLLCERFLAEAARDLGTKKVPELHADALEFLRLQNFRGNIRELKHLVKGAAVRAHGGVILPKHLDVGRELRSGAHGNADPVGAAGDPSATWKERLEDQEKRALRETLAKSGGNLTRGAELFGVPRTTYREKLVKHGLLREGRDTPGS